MDKRKESSKRPDLRVVSPPKSSAGSWDPKRVNRIAQELVDSLNQTVREEQEADRKAGPPLLGLRAGKPIPVPKWAEEMRDNLNRNVQAEMESDRKR